MQEGISSHLLDITWKVSMIECACVCSSNFLGFSYSNLNFYNKTEEHALSAFGPLNKCFPIKIQQNIVRGPAKNR